jgi:rfaE bifunctional protein kinase chain/domain
MLFGSGEVRFSSLELIRRELLEIHHDRLIRPADYFKRHNLRPGDLIPYVERFSEVNVVIVGDLIVDEYISCEALGMSQEDPTLVVTPIKSDRFLGGAGIVAAHAQGLGANAQYVTVVGEDEPGEYACQKLAEYGVRVKAFADPTRPTTLKQRFRANGKTLLRMNHLRQHAISEELMQEILTHLEGSIEATNLLVFADFNYGCLPQVLVDRIVALCQRHGVLTVADSQASSQFADISRFKGVHLITPTEREARLAMQDFNSGLVAIADNLLEKTKCPNLVVTLGREGMVIHTPPADRQALFTDQLPALNPSPVDVSGAGDALLTSTALGLAVGLDIWRASYLGAIAAAIQVSRIGNTPLCRDHLLVELR